MAVETTATTTTTEEPTTTAAAKESEEKGVTFTTEQMAEANRIAEERAQRASSAAMKDYFKQQGMTEDEAKAALEEFKNKKAAEKTPEQLASEAQAAAKEKVDAAKGKLLSAAAETTAAALGVPEEKINYVLRMADMSDVNVSDDLEIDREAVKAAIQKVLTDIPELATTFTPAHTPSGTPAAASTQVTGSLNDAIKQALYGGK